ncbi:hypothetical protein [Qaidamihabitans albus]|uniref:hypothetical protein n=1 Tax=Qaidamihabitans albus TaxID=2795733 RepID=UPI0018F201AB|nr:hypothetical protein [Qaidamihabitans albus]
MSDDPERLLAEALRAQARNAPPVVETPNGYGLLSGAGEGSLEREWAALEAEPVPATAPAAEPEPGPPLAAHWVLLLAALLGLAAGSVVGVLTLV